MKINVKSMNTRTYVLKTGEVNYLDEVKKYESKYGLDTERYVYEVIQGRGRYNKVVAISNEGTVHQSQRAVAFIDRVTGSMFTAASWSQPARTRIA